ncbi:MAG: hypothetical protein WCJ30_14985 [Deltaproteobacteria bacterium]
MKTFKFVDRERTRYEMAPRAELHRVLPRSPIELRAELAAALKMARDAQQVAERAKAYDVAALVERCNVAEGRALAVRGAVQDFANTLTARMMHHPHDVPEWILEELEETLRVAELHAVETTP